MSGTIVLTQTDTPTAPSAGQTALSFPATLLNQIKFVDGDGNTNIIYFPAGGGTLTIPATGTTALLATENVFAAAQTIGNLNLSGNVIASTSGAVTVTPLAGQNLNVNLSTTGDFVVNTNQFYVDTSTGFIGFGTASPGTMLHTAATAKVQVASTANAYISVKAGVDGEANIAFENDVQQFRLGTFGTVSDIFGIYDDTINSFRLAIATSGNVLIDTTTDITSAKLQIGGTTGALLLSRLTTTQRDALTPTNGMILYNSTLGKFQGYEAGAWANLI